MRKSTKWFVYGIAILIIAAAILFVWVYPQLDRSAQQTIRDIQTGALADDTQTELCILDEPFSALDTVAEEHILKEILANQSNKITVLITHRYDDLTNQENIIVMEDGAVSAFGSFRELSTTSNIFAHLLRHIE